MIFFESTIDNFNKFKAQKLSYKHDPNREENISKFLLDLIGLKGCQLKVDERNTKRQISFRDIKNICMVDENLIITKNSPIYTDQNYSKTAEDSVFKLILSGKDDDELETLENPKIYKARLNGKIELLKQNIEKTEKNLIEINKRLGKLELREINIKIDEITNSLNISRQGIVGKEKDREKIWEKIKPLSAELEQFSELKKRLILLDKNYEIDLKRMDFINEGSQIMDQLNLVFCPLCESEIEGEKEFSSDLFESIKKEYGKIILKKKELQETLTFISEQEKQINLKLKQYYEEFQKVEEYIANKLKPLESIKKKELEEYLKLKEMQAKISFLEAELTSDKQDKEYYEKKFKDKPEQGQKRIIEDQIYDNFGKEVKFFLNEWGINPKKVEYDRKTNDILLDLNMRKNHGKGYRAIFLSAFLLGLMKYCIDYGQKHPFFIVLDSPLTSYQEGDKEGDKLPEEIQNKFFEILAKFTKESGTQIIILDNKEPTEELGKKINYTHFSGNPAKDRFGFFPVDM